ncbi:hypothetical protein [uncultured Cohaesibacter sp.]|uniref:glucosamine inositolphosphorylceramide transferase family protein n=1 Tax=uncultured Cohaesibacter sp. TaxID=1002546 RepID=UPI00292E9E74
MARDLEEKSGAQVAIRSSIPQPYPTYIERFLTFEEGLYPANKANGATRCDLGDLETEFAQTVSAQRFDLVIDLVGDGHAPDASRHLTILFNGYPGATALLASIMQTGMPQIALRDNEGQIVATAMPSGELAAGAFGAMDQTFARVITLLRAYLGHPDRWLQPLVEKRADFPSQAHVTKRMAKAAFIFYLKKGYYLFFHFGHWRTGWRFVTDEDVWSRFSLDGEKWTVLPDRDLRFYADPVPWQVGDRYYLFFEDLDRTTQKGVISVMEFDDKGPTGPARLCLEEPFHLSYPFLIEHEGEIYMIPETAQNRDVAIYKATNFPFGWKRVKVILSDIDAADVTLTRQDGLWWIFCVTRDGAGGYSDCLSLYYADDLFGPWQPHAQNPVLIDKATARPGGNFLRKEGRLLRPVQDCSISYGAAMQLVEVTHLSPEHYEQRSLAKLAPNSHWPGRNLHTLNRAGNLEVIDGIILRPKFNPLKHLANWFYRPK